VPLSGSGLVEVPGNGPFGVWGLGGGKLVIAGVTGQLP
jgi:hypothetical protein